MIYFELPDSAITRKINIRLIEIMKECPELFLENEGIEAVFGCPYGCIWNGGSVNLPFEKITEKSLHVMFEDYEKLGVGYRLTFTNRCLSSGDLNDEFGNMILRAGNKKGNSVIVATDLMQNYVIEEYTNYTIIQSVSRVYEQIEQINKALEEAQVCIPIWLNNRWEELEKLRERSNVIILVNEYCPVDRCEFCNEHYDEISKYNMKITKEKYICKKSDLREKIKLADKKPFHIVNPSEYQRYSELGIRHFKINGRASNEEQIIDLYTFYFGRKEYADKIKDKLKQK